MISREAWYREADDKELQAILRDPLVQSGKNLRPLTDFVRRNGLGLLHDKTQDWLFDRIVFAVNHENVRDPSYLEVLWDLVEAGDRHYSLVLSFFREILLEILPTELRPKTLRAIELRLPDMYSTSDNRYHEVYLVNTAWYLAPSLGRWPTISRWLLTELDESLQPEIGYTIVRERVRNGEVEQAVTVEEGSKLLDDLLVYVSDVDTDWEIDSSDPLSLLTLVDSWDNVREYLRMSFSGVKDASQFRAWVQEEIEQWN